jgi:hypothetical protein
MGRMTYSSASTVLAYLWAAVLLAVLIPFFAGVIGELQVAFEVARERQGMVGNP